MCDQEVQHQSHRTRHIREITSQFDIPTSLTPAFNHLLCFHFVGCPKEVINLTNRPVVSLLGTRVVCTSAEVVPKRIDLNFRQPYVYYESLNRELKTKTIYGCRCDERLKN